MRNIFNFKSAILLAIVSFAATGFVANAAGLADLAGSWTVTASSPRGDVTETLTITEDGSGTYGTEEVSVALESDKVSFDATRETPGGSLPMSFSGTVDGDNMNGEYTVDFSAMAGGGMGGGMGGLGMGGGATTWTAVRAAE